MKRYAISDIHGCAKTFEALLEKISFSKEDHLYLLGDYVDRGPDSKAVIDHIWKLQSEGFRVSCLKGNHEQMMLNAFWYLSKREHWLRQGGLTTVSSFGVQAPQDIPREYIQWMEKLPFFIETKEYILVHAGLNFKVSAPLRDLKSLIWIRRWYEDLDRDWLGDRIIVHGHTPIVESVIKNMLSNLKEFPVIDIDGGCVFMESKYRVLCAMNLDDQTLIFQKNIEFVKAPEED